MTQSVINSSAVFNQDIASLQFRLIQKHHHANITKKAYQPHILLNMPCQQKSDNHVPECQVIQMLTTQHRPPFYFTYFTVFAYSNGSTVNLILEEPCGVDNCHGSKLNSNISCQHAKWEEETQPQRELHVSVVLKRIQGVGSEGGD